MDTPFKVGDRVQHYGTRLWGVVQEVVEQGPGQSPELHVRLEKPPFYVKDGHTWWAGYHIGRRDHTYNQEQPK